MLTLTSPVETRLHRIPAGAKLALLAAATMLVFPLTDLFWIGAVALAVVGLYAGQGSEFTRHGFRMMRPVWPFLVVLALWHGWSGTWAEGLGIALKMLAAIGLANLVTMTTRLDDLIVVVEKLARPFARLGVSPHVLAVAIALVIRFTPTMFVRTERLRDAWRARSPRRAGWQIVLPAALMALDDADHVADALRARGGL
jgi:biotin transport system permease protein